VSTWTDHDPKPSPGPHLNLAQQLGSALLPWYRPEPAQLADGPCVITTEKEAEAR
jgi:hypothetical protein